MHKYDMVCCSYKWIPYNLLLGGPGLEVGVISLALAFHSCYGWH